MGANQSNAEELSHDQSWAGKSNSQNRGHNLSGSSHNQGMLEKLKKSKAKPNPPIRIKFLDVTHNAITLSWHASLGSEGHSIIAYTIEVATICPGRDSHWRTLTKCCQGTTYEARYLEPDTDYVFRVRSENIFGVGKPSQPSDICTTKMFETFPTESAQMAKRHYSFNMHIGKGVKSILNHSEIDIDSTASSNSSSASASDRLKNPHIFLRNNVLRTSLPSSRKISAPLFLPGTRNNSLNHLRDSRKCAKTDTSDSKRRISARDSGIGGLKDSLTVFDSNSVNSQSSEEDGEKKPQDFRSHRLAMHSHKRYANSTDGDSGKGSKNSLCDSTKVGDNQSIASSTDTDLVVSDRKSVTGLKVHDSQSITDSTDGDVAASNGRSVTVNSNHSNIGICENINLLGDMDVNPDIDKISALDHIDKNPDSYKTKSLDDIDENPEIYQTKHLGDTNENHDIYKTKSLGDIDENSDIYKTKSLGDIDENTDIYKTSALSQIDGNTAVFKSQEKPKDIYFADGNLSMTKPGNNKKNSDVVFSNGSQKQDYYDTLDNPWHRDASVGDVSKQILAAPVSDDVKMALYSKNLPRNQRYIPGNGRASVGLATKEATDFRKLRSVLQSSNVIMKNSRSVPDVVAIVTVNGETKTVVKGKLTTILNTGANEDDAVRITTL